MTGTAAVRTRIRMQMRCLLPSHQHIACAVHTRKSQPAAHHALETRTSQPPAAENPSLLCIETRRFSVLSSRSD